MIRRRFSSVSSLPLPNIRMPATCFTRLCAAARELLTRHAVARLDGIGVSCGGPLNSETGVILSPPHLPGWDRVPIVEWLTREFQVRARLQNDANAGALAEWRYGSGRGRRNVIFCTFGTGFGAGLVLNGRLYTGTNDMAGEVGHVRLRSDGPVGYGKRGSVDGCCSGSGIAQLARQYILEEWQQGKSVAFCATQEEFVRLSARDVAMAAHAGDALALAIFREVGAQLGRALAILVDILNPEVIILGGVFMRSEALLRPEMERVLLAESLPIASRVCRVVPAELGEEIGDYASLAVALMTEG